MPIQVTCRCGKKLAVPDALAGRKGKCPSCGTVLVIPVPGAAAVPASAKPAPAKPAPAKPVPVAAKAPEAARPKSPPTASFSRKAPSSPSGSGAAGTKQCPVCGSPVKAQEIFCVKCGASVEQRAGSSIRKKKDATTTFHAAAAPRWKVPLIAAGAAGGAFLLLWIAFWIHQGRQIGAWRTRTENGSKIEVSPSTRHALAADPRKQKHLARSNIETDIRGMGSLFFSQRAVAYEDLYHMVDLAATGSGYRPDMGWWKRRKEIAKIAAWFEEGSGFLYLDPATRKFAILPAGQRPKAAPEGEKGS